MQIMQTPEDPTDANEDDTRHNKADDDDDDAVGPASIRA